MWSFLPPHCCCNAPLLPWWQGRVDCMLWYALSRTLWMCRSIIAVSYLNWHFSFLPHLAEVSAPPPNTLHPTRRGYRSHIFSVVILCFSLLFFLPPPKKKKSFPFRGRGARTRSAAPHTFQSHSQPPWTGITMAWQQNSGSVHFGDSKPKSQDLTAGLVWSVAVSAGSPRISVSLFLHYSSDMRRGFRLPPSCRTGDRRPEVEVTLCVWWRFERCARKPRKFAVKKSLALTSSFITVIRLKVSFTWPHTRAHTHAKQQHFPWRRCARCENEPRPLSAVQSPPPVLFPSPPPPPPPPPPHSSPPPFFHIIHRMLPWFHSLVHPFLFGFVFVLFKAKYIKYRKNFIIKRVLHECMFTWEIIWK